MKEYDLYSEFGLALGTHPRIIDEELNALTVAIRLCRAASFIIMVQAGN